MFFSILLVSLTLVVDQVLPRPLLTPPFEYTANGVSEIDTPELTLIEDTQNSVIDYEEWFDALPGQWPGATFHNGGVNDAIRGNLPPDEIAAVLYAPGNTIFYLYQIINSEDFIIATYGSPPNRFDVILDPSILVLMAADTYKIVSVLDFLRYAHDPEESPEEEMLYTFQALKWAEAHDGILYVSNAHRTYSESSNGSNAYITALDIQTNEILWRSQPLVSNSENFLVFDDVIVTGYGFTDEDDFIYILDSKTGETLSSTAVPSAPEYFFRDGSDIYVRCYDSDCLFTLI